VERTAGKDWRAEVTLFEEILDGRRPESILEVGCNVGLNLLAIHELLPDAQLAGIEPNENAVRAAPRMADVRVGVANRLPFPGGSFDLVFTRAVLMHLSPETYAETFKEMRRVARRWLLLIEPPAEIREGILYAGRDDVAFADDWARICRQAVPDARLLGEGRADYLTNWWLFELSSGPSERER
jgi:SAM-dependent methyltransferase